MLLEALIPLAEHAAREGVWLALEALNRYEDYMINRLDQVVGLAQEVEEATGTRSIRACADFFHLNIEEDDLAKAIVAAGPWIAHVHVDDSNRLQPGTGHLDFAGAFAALREIGYDGWHTLECRLRGEPETALPATAAFLRQFAVDRPGARPGPADRVRGPARRLAAGLVRLLDGPLARAFGGVHVLPFYRPVRRRGRRLRPRRPPRPSTRGWARGTTSPALARATGTSIADLIVNHVSAATASSASVSSRVTRRRTPACSSPTTRSSRTAPPRPTWCASSGPGPGLPFTPCRARATGTRLVWTTFTAAPDRPRRARPGRPARTCRAVLRRLAECGVAMVRLDASATR